LRNNPFAPYVPCHRVVASNRSVGGFCGEWDGKAGAGKSKTAKEKKAISHCDWKVRMLALEGVEFDSKGILVDSGVLWKP
jgi:methylated-DNA-[protein]-cysteine S-methyltransferase